MDQIHHPGSSNKCWIQEKWRQPCFLNRPIAAVDTPQKIHNLNLEWLKIEIVIVRGGVSTAPIGLSTILIGLSTILIGLSTVCPWFVHGFGFSFFLKKEDFWHV